MSNLQDQKSALFGKAPLSSVSQTTSTTKASTTKSLTSTNTSSSLNAAKLKKRAEADEAKEKAQTYLKTSMFQWKPDYVAAAPTFERAAEAYKQGDDIPNAITMLIQAAECHEGYNALSSVAVCNGKAAVLEKQLGAGHEKKVAQYYKTSAEYWGLAGDIHRYAEHLVKAAKEVEDVDVKEASALYKRAMGVIFPDGIRPEAIPHCPPSTPDIMRSVFSFFVKSKEWDEAIKFSNDMVKVFIQLELESSAFKVLTSVTILRLAQGDVVKAQQGFLNEHMNVPGYAQAQESHLADDLTMAFNQNDIEKLDKAKRAPDMNYLDFEVQKIGRALTIFSEFDEVPAAAAPPAVVVKGTPVRPPVAGTSAASSSASPSSSSGLSSSSASGAASSSISAGFSSTSLPEPNKDSLFSTGGAKKKAPAATPAAPPAPASSSATSKPQPPPPPPPPPALVAPKEEEPGDGSEFAELDNLNIDEEEGDEEEGASTQQEQQQLQEEEYDAFAEELTQEVNSAIQGGGSNSNKPKPPPPPPPSQPAFEEDDDDVDLS